jgi:hypothetical protein
MQFSFNDTIKKIFLLLFAMQLSNIVCSQNKKTFLNYEFIDFDSSFSIEKTALKSAFNNQQELTEYLKRLPNLLMQKGFPFSSVDTVYQQNNQTFVKFKLSTIAVNSEFSAFLLNEKNPQEFFFNQQFKTQLDLIYPSQIDYIRFKSDNIYVF